MNITQENTGDLTAILKIELVKDDYEAEVTTALKDYQRKASIPGFRPGKVPFGMIKKMYGDAVMADKINKLLSESISDYIKDNDLKIFGNPLPNEERTKIIDFKNQTEFEFYFDLGLYPDFNLELSDKIEVDYHNIDVDDKIVDKYLSNLLKQYGTMVNPEVSEANDRIFGEFSEVDNAGNVIENGINNKASVIPAFINSEDTRNNLIGLSKGDKIIFNPIIATDSISETAALLGIQKEEAEKLESDFQFSVEEISRINPASLDEDFFSKVYPHKVITTEEELRHEIRNEVATVYVKESDNKFMNDAVKKLIEVSDIPLPDDFLRRWLKEGHNDNMSEEEIAEQYDSFARSMRWHLIESKVVDKFKIEVKDEDIKSEIKGYFSSKYSDDSEYVKDERLDAMAETLINNKDELKRISDKIFDDKLLDLLKSELKIMEKNVSHDDFIKMVSE